MKHGDCKQGITLEYRTWQNIKTRCLNPKNRCYKWYGAKGIKLAKRWLKFENFLADMGRKPPGYTLDRKNPNGNYTKRNCRWATWTTQQRNRTNTLKPGQVGLIKHLRAKGYTQADIAKRLHTTQTTVWDVLNGRAWR